jgi:RNA polymerase sigma factor (TIGR02999 family)
MQAGEITELLNRWRDGDDTARNRLFERVYDELRALARRRMQGESPGHTLQPTALVHEVYERLADADVEWTGRTHFMAVAASAIRRLLVDHARARGRAKRGGEAIKISLDDASTIVDGSDPQLTDLDEALLALGRWDLRKERVLEMHYFGGLTQPQIAEAVGISAATVDRDLRLGRLWLKRFMEGES